MLFVVLLLSENLLLEGFFQLSSINFQLFLKKNAKKFGHIKKKQYLCTRFC